MAYGNDVVTRYAYEPDTFRLARMRTQRMGETVDASGVTYAPQGGVRQDTAYEYDLAGNIVEIRERANGSGIANTTLGVDKLDRAFSYDALYRLLSATGREHDSAAPSPPWLDDAPRGSSNPDPNAARAYTRAYTYDALGNALTLQHTTPGGTGDFTRTYTPETGKNHLASTTIGSTTYANTYDQAGNLVQESLDRHFVFDAAGRPRSFRVQTSGSEPSVYARYLYDAGGNRVKKVVRKQGGTSEATSYLGAFEWHEDKDNTGVVTRTMSLTHVMDDTRRIAQVQAGTAPSGDTRPPVRYHLGDHLGNSTVVLGGNFATNAAVISKEEYYPFGETSFGSHGKKRYRYNGKERDGESGLYMYGARYYAPYQLRFVSIDPLFAQYPFYQPYAYAGNRSVSFVDLDGMQPSKPQKGTPSTTGTYIINSDASGANFTPGPVNRYYSRDVEPQSFDIKAEWTDSYRASFGEPESTYERHRSAAVGAASGNLREMSPETDRALMLQAMKSSPQLAQMIYTAEVQSPSKWTPSVGSLIVGAGGDELWDSPAGLALKSVLAFAAVEAVGVVFLSGEMPFAANSARQVRTSSRVTDPFRSSLPIQNFNTAFDRSIIPTTLNRTGSTRHALPSGSTGRGVMYGTADDAQALLSEFHAGHFKVLRQTRPNSIVVDFGHPVGEFVSRGVNYGPTNYASIHFGGRGAHFAPARQLQW